MQYILAQFSAGELGMSQLLDECLQIFVYPSVVTSHKNCLLKPLVDLLAMILRAVIFKTFVVKRGLSLEVF